MCFIINLSVFKFWLLLFSKEDVDLKEYLNPSFVDPFVLRKVPVYGLVGGSTIWSVSNKGITDTEMNA